jgi:hypothetical protein
MTARYAVTFEFETKPPLTLHGTVSAAGMPTCVARAARTAMREAGRQTWASVVVVIERESPSAIAEAAAVSARRPINRVPGLITPSGCGQANRPRPVG